MKSAVLFAAASLMLIGAIVALTLTNAAQAAPPTGWCINGDASQGCGNTPKACRSNPGFDRGVDHCVKNN